MIHATLPIHKRVSDFGLSDSTKAREKVDSLTCAIFCGQERVAGYGWWRREGPANWGELLKVAEVAAEASLRGCTYAGRPFGEESFVSDLGEKGDGKKGTA